MIACAEQGGRAPPDLSLWLPWSMSPERRKRFLPPPPPPPPRMTDAIECRYYARGFTIKGMARLRTLIVGPPALNRHALSKEFCRRIGWRKPDGGIKDMMARVTMLTMHRDGVLQLPLPKWPYRQLEPIILSWINIPKLSSHILAIVRRHLPGDSECYHIITHVLIETFVETLCKASGWTRVGTTPGRGRYAGTISATSPEKTSGCGRFGETGDKHSTADRVASRGLTEWLSPENRKITNETLSGLVVKICYRRAGAGRLLRPASAKRLQNGARTAFRCLLDLYPAPFSALIKANLSPTQNPAANLTYLQNR